MCDHISTTDWIRHLHVQVAKWEENNGSKRCCLNKRIDHMTLCLVERLSTCKLQGRVPNIYSNEVHSFFEFLKDPKMDTKHISKLVKIRNRTISLLDVFCRFCHFSEEEKQKTINKFEKKDCHDLTEIVQILIQLVPVTGSIQSQQPYGGSRDQTLNVTTWLRHMYRFFLKEYNNIPGRVRWRDVHNGVDPNNTEEFQTKERLIRELKSLVPLCIQYISMPRPYKEEIQLLQHYLDSEELDKTKVQSEQKTRKLAMEMTEALLTLLKERQLRNDVVQNIPPPEVGRLLFGLNDVQNRILSMATLANENMMEHHEEERNEHPFHTGTSSVKHSDSSRLDQFININDSSRAILSDDTSSRKTAGDTIHKSNTVEDGSNVLPLPNKQLYQPTVSNVEEETCKLKLFEECAVDDYSPTVCGANEDDIIDLLEEDIDIDPSVFDDISDNPEIFHIPLQAVTKMTYSSEVYSDDVLKERCVLKDINLGNYTNFGSLQISKPSKCSTNTNSVVTSDIPTKSTSYTPSDLMLGYSSHMEFFPKSPSFQGLEVPPNEYVSLKIWSDMGHYYISISDTHMLKKILKMVTELKMSAEERLQQTNVNTEGFSDRSRNKVRNAFMFED